MTVQQTVIAAVWRPSEILHKVIVHERIMILGGGCAYLCFGSKMWCGRETLNYHINYGNQNYKKKKKGEFMMRAQ